MSDEPISTITAQSTIETLKKVEAKAFLSILLILSHDWLNYKQIHNLNYRLISRICIKKLSVDLAQPMRPSHIT